MVWDLIGESTWSGDCSGLVHRLLINWWAGLGLVVRPVDHIDNLRPDPAAPPAAPPTLLGIATAKSTDFEVTIVRRTL